MKAKIKKIMSMLLAVTLTAGIAIGGTLAYLTIDAGDENNVFSIGNINVSLDEEVGIFGEGGEVKEKEDGAEYIEVMPGDYLKKEVTVTNNGKTPAYVAVTVILNNADKINKAIDEVYGDGVKGGQAMYDFIFDGWGINQNPRPGAYNVNDARGVIDGTYGLPEHVLHVDFAKTTSSSTVIGATNWFIAGAEKAGQYWVDNSRGEGKVDNGYYTADMADYEICYTYYMLMPAGESSTLFEGLNVPAEFNADQLAMFDGLEIKVEAKAIQADNMAIADQYKGDLNGKAKTAFAILAGDIEVPEYSGKPTGKNAVGFTSANAIWGESTGNAKQSFEIKIYSDDTYMGYASLKNIDGIIDGDVTATWTLYLDPARNGSSDSYWEKNWVVAPSIDVQPTTVELWIDGVKVDEGKVQLNAPDDLNKITGAVIDTNGTILRYIVKGTGANLQTGETYVPFVSGSNALNDALDNGSTTLYLQSGEYIVDTAKNKTLTIYGSEDAVIKVENESGALYTNPSDGQGVDYSFDGSTVTFNGVTIDTTENGGTYPSFARMSGIYNNCTINGTYVLGTGINKFNNCTLNVSGDAYNIWTWGSTNTVFNSCTFNCDGKSVLVYNQSTTLDVKNCVFNDKGGLVDEQKAAIETGADNATSATYTINIENTTVNGFSTTAQKSDFGGTSLGTNVWGNKNLLDKDHLNVKINSTEEY